MALSNPFDPPPNTPILPDPTRDSVWRRWFEMIWKRIQSGALGGTVTSVGLSLPTSVFDVSGSPVTTSGTLTATFDTQAANTAFMGPTSGGAATPAFRTLVPADIPAATPLTIGTTPILSGTAGRVLFEGTGNVLQEDSGLSYDAATDTLTVGAVVSLPDGTAAAPSLKIGDEQNGFYSGGVNQLSLALGGFAFYTYNAGTYVHSVSSSGNTISDTVSNASNTANSSALHAATVAGTSAGDAFSRWAVGSTASFAAGIDNSDSDSFKISYAASGTAVLGTNDYLTINTSGALGFSSSFGSSGQVLTSGGNAAAPTWTTPTTGTVTSVAIAGNNGIGISGSPITSSGTITLSLGAITPTSVVTGDLTANGNTTLGDAAADTVTINAETVSQPNIPCFLVYASSSATGVTGNGTTYTVAFDTEVFDQSGDFASNTFTAPATGRYLLSAQVTTISLASTATQLTMRIVTSNANYNNNMVFTPIPATTFNQTSVVIADMDAGDTAIVDIIVSGLAGNTAGVQGTANLVTRFSGVRIA